MPYREIYQLPDGEYNINCTGDVCRGDEIVFTEAKFTGSYRKPKFSHADTVFAKVINDSYGERKQQHTFTLKVISATSEKNTAPAPGDVICRKGRNVYKNGCYRKQWDNESVRKQFIQEKHERGDVAREARRIRKAESMFSFSF